MTVIRKQKTQGVYVGDLYGKLLKFLHLKKCKHLEMVLIVELT
jgi:hypothetical protein